MAKSIEKTKTKAKAKSVGVYPVTEIIGTVHHLGSKWLGAQ